MKKKVTIITIIVLLLILVIPIRTQYKDGGTVEYKSLTYKYIKWHRLDDNYKDGIYTGTEFHFFPYNFKPLDYFKEVKPPRFGLYYKDTYYRSELLSYCWHDDYKAICADTLGPLDINYENVIEADKNDTLSYAIPMNFNSVILYDEEKVVDYQVKFDNVSQTVIVPDLSETYIMEFRYKGSEGSVGYSFKLNIK